MALFSAILRITQYKKVVKYFILFGRRNTMLRKLIISGLFIFIILLSSSISGFAQNDADGEVMEKFKKAFPRVKPESIGKADIEGMYEVNIPGKILYYFPEKDYLFVGSIWNSADKNLTDERESQIITEKVKNLSLEKAVKLGKGERVIIEFTNPDCSYCRNASKFLSQQDNIVKYVFFVHFGTNKDTEQKIRYVLCGKDREKAYKEAMNGDLDKMGFALCNDEKVEALLNEHKRISSAMGINSTPQFWIEGKHVQGADIPLIGKLLGIKSKEQQEKKQ
jgi:thiol:disulfide interchange protein DsbC